MRSLPIHVYGVDELPLPNTCIVLLTMEEPFNFDLCFGKVRYDYPEKYNSHLDALSAGVPFCDDFDLWYDEDGNATHVACIVDEEFNLNVGDKWCYQHEYYSICVHDNIFPFSDVDYRDIAIDQNWVELVNYHEKVFTDHPQVGTTTDHMYTFRYNNLTFKAVWVSIGVDEVNSPNLHQYYVATDEEPDDVFDWENMYRNE